MPMIEVSNTSPIEQLMIDIGRAVNYQVKYKEKSQKSYLAIFTGKTIPFIVNYLEDSPHRVIKVICADAYNC